MGFFSGVSKVAGGLSGLFGGPETSQNIPASGFYTMPESYQNFYNTLLSSGKNVLFPNGQPNADMFTPLPQTAEETRGLELINKGITPTQESLASDLSMLMNPFDDFVINDINRQAIGENSLVNQYSTLAGQQGSNRSFLGTSDVEQNRLNNIGMFRQNQYNTAIDKILGPLALLKQGDIENLMGAGGFQRNLDLATKQAPFSALSAGGSLLGGLPTSFGNQYQGGTVNSGSSTGSTLSKIGDIASVAASLAGLFSDYFKKENLEKVGEKNGHNIYRFNYKGSPQKFEGVVAQEVLEKDPDAVHSVDGHLMVDYARLGVEMKVIHERAA